VSLNLSKRGFEKNYLGFASPKSSPKERTLTTPFSKPSPLERAG
jgi:hypothetical protein